MSVSTGYLINALILVILTRESALACLKRQPENGAPLACMLRASSLQELKAKIRSLADNGAKKLDPKREDPKQNWPQFALCWPEDLVCKITDKTVDRKPANKGSANVFRGGETIRTTQAKRVKKC